MSNGTFGVHVAADLEKRSPTEAVSMVCNECRKKLPRAKISLRVSESPPFLFCTYACASVFKVLHNPSGLSYWCGKHECWYFGPACPCCKKRGGK